MIKKILLLCVLLGGLTLSIAQKHINDYKYVVVPLKFDFVKGQDQFRLNTLTRYLFNENGFTAFFDVEELPEDLFKDRCLAMYADVVKLKGGLKTSLQIVLKDCRGELILKSEVGTNKIKSHAKSYPLAIRTAFESIKFLNYEYKPKVALSTSEAKESSETEVQKLQEEIKALKAEKEAELSVKTTEVKKPKAEATASRPVVTAESTISNNHSKKASTKAEVTANDNMLYAQATGIGFQVKDAASNKIMILVKSAVPNVYIVKGKDAIVFKEASTWYYSENNSKRELNIRF